jgi:PIN domain nuclease of toxin-antitoxin system
VTGYLLDTNVALLGLASPNRIPIEVRRTLESRSRYLSVLSYWEVLLKTMKGKLDVGDPRVWWPEALDQLAATPLALRPDHIATIYTLEAIHQDPFDRALIAQATAEQLTLVTTDSEISKYRIECLLVVPSV